MRALVVGLVFVFACSGGSKQSPQSAISQTWTAPSMLAKVPADAPYLVAMIDPLPRLVREQMFEELDEKFEEQRARLLDPTLDRSTLDENDRALLAVFEELEGRDRTHWGRELGFDESGRFVLYGLSVWPVLRIAVANENRLRQVIANVIRKAGIPYTQHTLQGRTYWMGGDGKLALIISVGDGDVVAAVLPVPAIPQYLPIVLGLQKPPRTLNDDNKLAALIARYHFMSSMVGYLDTKIVADIIGQRAATTNTELDRPLREAMGPVHPTCKDDLARLAAFAPRLAVGYRRLDAKGMQGAFVLELPPDVAASLQRLRVAVPELERGLGARAMMKFGVGARLDELWPLLKQLTEHIAAEPFKCTWFTELNSAAAELSTALDRPVPAPLLGFRGVSFVVDDMRKEPLDMRGHAIMVGDHASDIMSQLIKLAGAGTTITPDGRPVQLPLATLGVPATMLGYAATRIDRAAIALGPNSANDVVEALNAPLPATSPLFSMTFDMQRMLDAKILEPKDANGIRDVSLQLEVAPEGLLLEMYGTFAGR